MTKRNASAGGSVTRRDFMGALGGLVAVAGLPSFAADDPALFPQRGGWERLMITARHINAGASKPFSILHISDTHLTAAYPHDSEWAQREAGVRAKTFGGRQEEALRDSLAWARAHVDYVLHTGDLIDFRSEANLDLARKYYGEGGAAMFGSLGNHEFYYGQPRAEQNESGKAASRAQLAAAYPFDISLASTVVNGVNFVALDNVYDTVTAEQATKFEAEVKKGLPVILCMHCPFQLIGVNRASRKFWATKALKTVPDMSGYSESYRDATTSDFVKYLKAQPLLKAILAGHAHIDVEERFSPTAMQYVVGGNFLFHGAEVTFS